MNSGFQYELLSDEGYSPNAIYTYIDEKVSFKEIESYVKLIFDASNMRDEKIRYKTITHPHLSTIHKKLSNSTTVIYHTSDKYKITYILANIDEFDQMIDYESIILESNDSFVCIEMNHGHPAIHTNSFSYGNSDGSGEFFNICDTNYHVDDLLNSLIVNFMNYSNDKFH